MVHSQLATRGLEASIPDKTCGGPTDCHGLSTGRFGTIWPAAVNWLQNGNALPEVALSLSEGSPAPAEAKMAQTCTELAAVRLRLCTCTWTIAVSDCGRLELLSFKVSWRIGLIGSLLASGSV